LADFEAKSAEMNNPVVHVSDLSEWSDAPSGILQKANLFQVDGRISQFKLESAIYST